ncbi:MAG: quinolinate synthase NadA [Candidatus Caenarcaniphilales bacterium]|nr:quinolinate synthase NadA [Candidatus Caenarcaniphilales bacterium]
MYSSVQELHIANQPLVENTDELADRIRSLLREKDAILLTHIYQRLEIQRISDHVADSLALSRIAAKTDSQMIVFCGVHFMAETAKLLSPSKTVLLPNLASGCPMADMITARDLIEFKSQFPEAPVVCYVNSSAAVKAESDICCTSTNAVDIVASLPEKRVVFVPDKGLGAWVQRQVPDKEIMVYDGFCPTHYQITTSEVERLRQSHPEAVIIAHPECDPSVWEMADFVGSTSQIYKFAAECPQYEVIVLSEHGLIRRMQADMPQKKFLMTFPNPLCPNMKYHRLETVLYALEKEVHKIEIPEYGLPDGLFERAKRTIDRMFEVTEHKYQGQYWTGANQKTFISA